MLTRSGIADIDGHRREIRAGNQTRAQGGKMTARSSHDLTGRQVYTCPRCRVDTAHLILAKRQRVYAVLCTNCRLPSLVREEDLLYCNSKWADELKNILHSLDDRDGHD